jgi:hypothetical protein
MTISVVASEEGLKLSDKQIFSLLDKADFYTDTEGRKMDLKKMDWVASFLPVYENYFIDGYLAANGLNDKKGEELFSYLLKKVNSLLPETPWYHLDEIFPLAKDVMVEYLDKWVAYQKFNWNR